jgi:hypothetical protein
MKSFYFSGFCASILLLFLLKNAYGFSECPIQSSYNSIWDPIHVFVSNCLALVAYYQSNGQNIQQWCSVPLNYQKCCLTCQSKWNITNGFHFIKDLII